MTIGQYKKIETSEENINHYRKTYPNLCHIRTGVDYKGIMLIDKEIFVAILQCNIKTGYITALEVNPKYRKQGIASYLLNKANTKFDNWKLTVRKTNTPAIELYKKHNWKVFKEEGIMLYMEKEPNRVLESISAPNYKDW